jgi:hypothetical protein
MKVLPGTSLSLELDVGIGAGGGVGGALCCGNSW